MKNPQTRSVLERLFVLRWDAAYRLALSAAALSASVLQAACTDVRDAPLATEMSSRSTKGLPFSVPANANFGGWNPSHQTRQLVDGILRSGDHAGVDFIIVDKQSAAIYAFDASGVLKGASPVLLGSALGDDTVPGIGSRPMAEVLPNERTTPAGRFVAERGRNTLGEDVIWVDYDAAVSMHRVRTAKSDERRLERLASPSAEDNRISYGCINVPVAFYEAVVAPIFSLKRAVVYILPDVKQLADVFRFPIDLSGS